MEPKTLQKLVDSAASMLEILELEASAIHSLDEDLPGVLFDFVTEAKDSLHAASTTIDTIIECNLGDDGNDEGSGEDEPEIDALMEDIPGLFSPLSDIVRKPWFPNDPHPEKENDESE